MASFALPILIFRHVVVKLFCVWCIQSEESTMAETAAQEAAPAPAIQIAPGIFARLLSSFDFQVNL